MAKLSMTLPLVAGADKIWDMIGGFNALPDWHPGIEKSELEDGGTIRRLTLAGGGQLVEKLTQTDEHGRGYSYEILESPLPMANYKATIKVNEDGNAAEVEWSCEFDAVGAPEADVTKIIQGVFQAGFDNLKKMYGG